LIYIIKGLVAVILVVWLSKTTFQLTGTTTIITACGLTFSVWKPNNSQHKKDRRTLTLAFLDPQHASGASLHGLATIGVNHESDG